MANTFVNLPSQASDGVGAAVDVSTLGKTKTLVIAGSWVLDPTINIEVNNDAAQLGSWAPVATFQGGGTITLDIAAIWMRVRVSNFRTGQAPSIDVGGETTLATVSALVATAGTGAGAGVDVSATGSFKTVQVGGPFRGGLLIEASTDGGVSWAPAFAFNAPGQQSGVVVADFMRARRVGVPPNQPGLPVVNVAAVPDGGGGSSGGGVAQRYTAVGGESDFFVTLAVPQATDTYKVSGTCAGCAFTVGIDCPDLIATDRKTTEFRVITTLALTALDQLDFVIV